MDERGGREAESRRVRETERMVRGEVVMQRVGESERQRVREMERRGGGEAE